MNKKEVSEIKSLFKRDGGAIDRICGCLIDGEQQIREAEDEISKIENAKWYINDRSVLTEYSGYGENADRMRAIGNFRGKAISV